MICKNCGAQTEGNFCNNCGAPLPKEVAGNNEYSGLVVKTKI